MTEGEEQKAQLNEIGLVLLAILWHLEKSDGLIAPTAKDLVAWYESSRTLVKP